jgi:hypothetical protein
MFIIRLSRRRGKRFRRFRRAIGAPSETAKKCRARENYRDLRCFAARTLDELELNDTCAATRANHANRENRATLDSTPATSHADASARRIPAEELGQAG